LERLWSSVMRNGMCELFSWADLQVSWLRVRCGSCQLLCPRGIRKRLFQFATSCRGNPLSIELAFMVVVGAYYLPFIFLYGMWQVGLHAGL
jgi:hypothetical protein